MVQALLADRFQLKMHRGMREMPVYALVVAKNGPKLKDSDPGADAGGLFDQQGRNVVVTLPKASMSDIVDAIGYANLDRPIVDKTGLIGTYNIKLTYTPNFKRYNGSAPDVDDLDVFQAVEKQLGLKLEARKDVVEMLVVDRVEKPSAN
jgi:bla regulator protein blaR1